VTAPANILVIDDDESMRDSCKQTLVKVNYQVELAENGQRGLDRIREKFFDIVILDLKMPGMTGMEVLKAIKKENPESVVVIITGYPTVESAVEAMKFGAEDFIQKPFTPDELRLIVKRAIEKRTLALRNLYLQSELDTIRESDLIIGRSRAMKKINDLIRKVGITDSTVLITGESGTGKELVSRAIHRHSLRSRMPFVTVDCSTLVENLFESELFGHIKGSFTGAVSTKHGRLELANGGTVFFDEIGNISPAVQAKLLRAIQEREITKVGSTQVIKIDIRIIAATNRDLRQSVQQKAFREDLFYRLSVVPIHLPPLRERREDIPILAEYFLEKYRKKRRKSIKGITPEAMETLVCYDWPGNVRELENTVERAVVLTDSDSIQTADLQYYGLDNCIDPVGGKSLEDVEKTHIQKTLEAFKGHKVKTAGVLGIDRKTLRLKMRKYKIED
jgi:DNA-binding NtrC family response regulator